MQHHRSIRAGVNGTVNRARARAPSTRTPFQGGCVRVRGGDRRATSTHAMRCYAYAVLPVVCCTCLGERGDLGGWLDALHYGNLRRWMSAGGGDDICSRLEWKSNSQRVFRSHRGRSVQIGVAVVAGAEFAHVRRRAERRRQILVAELLAQTLRRTQLYQTIRHSDPNQACIHTCGKFCSSCMAPSGPDTSGGVSSTLSPVNSESK